MWLLQENWKKLPSVLAEIDYPWSMKEPSG